MKKVQELFVPSHPDLADIFGRTYVDVEMRYALYSFGFQISRFPDWARLGPGLAEPGLGKELSLLYDLGFSKDLATKGGVR